MGWMPFRGIPVRILYTNWRGETAWRTIEPQHLWHGSNEWHPETQYFLRAWDVKKQSERDFAMAGIEKWEGVAPDG